MFKLDPEEKVILELRKHWFVIFFQGLFLFLVARLTDVGEVKSRLADLSHDVAALNERSETTLEMVHSIQEFLRGGSKHG